MFLLQRMFAAHRGARKPGFLVSGARLIESFSLTLGRLDARNAVLE
jgi:hypothetical protein